MSKRKTFEATRPDGIVVRRTSDSRNYTHCVAIWKEATLPTELWPKGSPAEWILSEWAGRHDLAVKTAARYNGKPGYRAEVLEARELPKVRKARA